MGRIGKPCKMLARYSCCITFTVLALSLIPLVVSVPLSPEESQVSGAKTTLGNQVDDDIIKTAGGEAALLESTIPSDIVDPGWWERLWEKWMGDPDFRITLYVFAVIGLLASVYYVLKILCCICNCCCGGGGPENAPLLGRRMWSGRGDTRTYGFQ